MTSNEAALLRTNERDQLDLMSHGVFRNKRAKQRIKSFCAAKPAQKLGWATRAEGLLGARRIWKFQAGGRDVEAAAGGKRREGGRGRGEGRRVGGLGASVVMAVGWKLAPETGARLCKGVAWPARADHGLCWAAVSWSLGLFGQELAHEEEVAEPAARTGAQVGRARAGLMLMID